RSGRTQCTQVRCGAAGSGASGSSTINARLRVPTGTSAHCSAGEMSPPSQVWRVGMAALSAKPGEASFIDMAFVLVSLQAEVAATRARAMPSKQREVLAAKALVAGRDRIPADSRPAGRKDARSREFAENPPSAVPPYHGA